MADNVPSIIRILPQHYIYVQNNNTNVTTVEIGPQTFTRKDHERVTQGPTPMIIIPPRHYCIVSNPVFKNEQGEAQMDKFGQARLRHGDEEIRFEQDPFPLYPGEKLSGKVTPLTVVQPNTALRLCALRDFDDMDGDKKVKRVAGDEWLFLGPGTYMPSIFVKVVELVKANIVKPNQALRLRARKTCKDINGVERKDGEEWLIRKEGAYLPLVDEEVVKTENAYTLTEKKALHLRAIKTFTDRFGKVRKAGEEWLVTMRDAETHIPDVYEVVAAEVNVITLNSRQYCYVLDPLDADGRPQLGKRELRRGEMSFFLKPGERLDGGVLDVYVLGEDEALLLRCSEAFEEDVIDKKEKKKATRQPGDLWMVYGPCEYVPLIHVEVQERRKAIPLDENEGVYVRDVKSGRVRAVIGQTYMLCASEVLWEKDLPSVVEELLARELDPLASRSDPEAQKTPTAPQKARDKTRVVSFRAPHNSAVQIYDYKQKKARTVFGPEEIMLGPDELFTVLSLSGGKPKRPNVIKALALLLGPDFMTDVVAVETSDHARLSLKLSYNWHFEVKDTKDGAILFQVPDFVGDACKAVGSRVRAAVASVSFDEFHKQSARIIRQAVFGLDDKGHVRDAFLFPANNLVITNIDIQTVEPVDQKTRDSLQKSVQLAIEITTQSTEATARHDAERIEQEARGKLERQKIIDEAEAEKTRRQLLALQAESAAVEAKGQARADAEAKLEAAEIDGQTTMKNAKYHAESTKLATENEMTLMITRQENEIKHQRSLNELEIARARDLATIESGKFKSVVDAIGRETIEAIARAGPEMQAKLLNGLGLQGYMITDGSCPINLFTTAQGMVGGASNMLKPAIKGSVTGGSSVADE